VSSTDSNGCGETPSAFNGESGRRPGSLDRSGPADAGDDVVVSFCRAEARHSVRRFRSRLIAVADAVLSALLAPECAACGALLEQPTRGAVCAACWASILPLTAPLCDECGDPLPGWRHISIPMARCPRCRRARRRITRGRAFGAYEGALRSIVHAFKYQSRRSLAGPLAERMRDRGASVLAGADAVVPVPLHPSRRRERGFNQAADLAKHLGLPAVAALRRVRATAAQAGLASGRRHANVRGAFAATRAARALTGKIVVLVDDVSTTGATLEACARALEAAQVAEVRALTAARVVTRLP
jgi:ComF family protein